MMYINLIWAWGHPEVYILILPAFGVFSEVVATFSGKRLFGYKSMVWAIVAITLLSFLVWLHHFFTMGAGANVNAFFGIMTMIIAVPTGVKVFNWLFTMYRGRIRLTTPMLWFLGFVATFTVGGVAGVLMSVPAIDFQVHNSLFLVAHFHTMIIGGVLFGAFSAFGYWFPKFSGWKLNETIGRWAFWCWLIGFLAAFVPLYILGLMGATRRLDHYDASLGWQGLFIVAGVGVVIIFAGVGLQLLQVLVSFLQRDKNRVGNDPWDGRTLEWAAASPPAEYNFAVIPTVTDRDAFWDMKQKGTTAPTTYEDIRVPKNTPLGMFIAASAFVFGFAIIWHYWWMAIIGFVGIVATLLVRFSDDDTETVITATEVAKTEAKIAQRTTA
jgi:cytochrome o ubiquinol oxidase subunit 1